MPNFETGVLTMSKSKVNGEKRVKNNSRRLETILRILELFANILFGNKFTGS